MDEKYYDWDGGDAPKDWSTICPSCSQPITIRSENVRLFHEENKTLRDLLRKAKPYIECTCDVNNDCDGCSMAIYITSVLGEEK